MSIISNKEIYNHILSNYYNPLEKDRQSRFDAHKRSDLRKRYNNIVKANKESPLYKINLSQDDVTKFAIDLKEGARRTENLIASLTVESDDMESIFHKRVATSSMEDNVHVEYIGNSENPSSEEFTIGINSIATPQINRGNFLPMNERAFETGTYTFDLDTPTNSYEFQFNVLENDKNIDVQNRIVRLINTSDIPLSSSVIKLGNETSAISITSKNTGLSPSEEYLFKISVSANASQREMDILGIDRVESPAKNSSFTLNGNERSSISNTFTINNDFEITLKAPTKGDAKIGFKTSTDAIADSVLELANAYNNFLTVGSKYADVGGDKKLLMEMSGLYRGSEKELQSLGLNINNKGYLELDREKFSDTINNKNHENEFIALNQFKDALLRQAKKTSINPLDYVNKVTVEYKNPGKSFFAPYAASRFSGLLVDHSL